MEATIVILVIYFLPSIIAFSKHKKQQWAIFFVNFTLGWTFAGWLWAMIWSIMRD